MRSVAIALIASLAAIGAEESLPPAFSAPAVVRQGQNVLWHDPGPVETLDFRYGIGGQKFVPQPPFTFLEEDTSGTNPKVQVRDANNRKWAIKFGDEAGPDTFCSRLAWAVGYYVEPQYFLSEGFIEGVHDLRRARRFVDSNGHFHEARFQLRSKEPRFLRTVDWSWNDNPFIGTPELNGLKVLMMLVSNWDDKDSRDADKRGSNTAIYQKDNLYIYFIDDWGAALGRWGKFFTRSKWDYVGFVSQTPDFVTIKNNQIHWGYVGQHTDLMTRDIQPSDIKWLLRYLNRVTDDQLRTGLLSSGASAEATEKYVEAFRTRIKELQDVS